MTFQDLLYKGYNISLKNDARALKFIYCFSKEYMDGAHVFDLELSYFDAKAFDGRQDILENIIAERVLNAFKESDEE